MGGDNGRVTEHWDSSLFWKESWPEDHALRQVFQDSLKSVCIFLKYIKGGKINLWIKQPLETHYKEYLADIRKFWTKWKKNEIQKLLKNGKSRVVFNKVSNRVVNHLDKSPYLGKTGTGDMWESRVKCSKGHTGFSMRSILIFLEECEIRPERDIEIPCHLNFI